MVLAAGRQHRLGAPDRPCRRPARCSHREDDDGCIPTGPVLRCPIAPPAAGVHRDGGGDARARHRRDGRDFRAGQRRHPEAAAVRRSRSAHARAPDLAGPRRRGAAAEHLVVAEVPGVSRPPARLRLQRDLQRLELEPDRVRCARARGRRADRGDLLPGPRHPGFHRPDLHHIRGQRGRVDAAGRARASDLAGPVREQRRCRRPHHRIERHAAHDHRRDARGVPRPDRPGRHVGAGDDAGGRRPRGAVEPLVLCRRAAQGGGDRGAGDRRRAAGR